MTAEPASLADRFCDTVDRINSRVGRFFALSILVVVIAVLYEVFARGMFGQATLWANETTIYLSAVAYVIGGGYALAHRRHVRIDVIYDRLSPRTRALVLSMHANPAYVVEAIQSGAAGYVLKGSSAAELVRAIRAVASGERHLSPPLSEEMVEAYAQRAVPTGLDLYRTLTQREREVLHLAAEGQTSAQIGARLNISPRTVEVHRANLMRKLGLRGQGDLVRYALGRGILTVDG